MYDVDDDDNNNNNKSNNNNNNNTTHLLWLCASLPSLLSWLMPQSSVGGEVTSQSDCQPLNSAGLSTPCDTEIAKENP